MDVRIQMISQRVCKRKLLISYGLRNQLEDTFHPLEFCKATRGSCLSLADQA